MQKVNDLLDLHNLGSEKPSVLMDNILSLWPDTTTKNTSKLLLGLFLRRLLLQMRSQLANFPATTPTELAADAIWSQSGGQVSAAAVTVAAATSGRPCSPSPRPNVSGGWACNSTLAPIRGSGGGAPRKQRWKDPVPGLCFYQCNFGAQATKCEHGCQWTPN